MPAGGTVLSALKEGMSKSNRFRTSRCSGCRASAHEDSDFPGGELRTAGCARAVSNCPREWQAPKQPVEMAGRQQGQLHDIVALYILMAGEGRNTSRGLSLLMARSVPQLSAERCCDAMGASLTPRADPVTGSRSISITVVGRDGYLRG
jgi:hypothetical protein